MSVKPDKPFAWKPLGGISLDFHRIFVEKKRPFDIEARDLHQNLVDALSTVNLTGLRQILYYDITGLTGTDWLETAIDAVLTEKPVDTFFMDFPDSEQAFAFEPVPGQYDQRADSAAQCLKLVIPGWVGLVRTGKVIICEGKLTDRELLAIRNYIVNPLENRVKELYPVKWDEFRPASEMIATVEGFLSAGTEKMESIRKDWGLAMSTADLGYVQAYFRDNEKRDPTETEIRVLDTYWSDHCRHTTFETEIESVGFPDSKWGEFLKTVWDEYLAMKRELGRDGKPVTLMELAVIYGRYLYKNGQLEDLDDSEEINACTVKIKADNNGTDEDWLLLFKNETHNHPTEIEPFGGASTCIGGAIRDPLSGRAYVYQAMRITGSADPREPVGDTLPGKLPQVKITREAARGYSSYGNQIGLATSHVKEIYHPGYKAKRMEVGAVVGAVKASSVRRESPLPGDVVILLGGKTGRDGIGGATGSSREHTVASLDTCGAEVQKGNAPEERKIQRLFRNPQVTGMIKKCNDFGAGGVSVAIGELSRGMEIDLDKVPLKYQGLNGTEIAISESQERMAVVVSPSDSEAFCRLAASENLETSLVAEITDRNRLVMKWKDRTIVDISRDFLDTHGVRQKASAIINDAGYPAVFDSPEKENPERFPVLLGELNNCSQRGLAEMFDSSIGSGTVVLPYGGRYRLSEAECSVHKLPIPGGKTKSVSFLAHGFDPAISSASPFLGSVNAVMESLSRLVASGGDWRKVRFSFQEYFRRLGRNPENWGLPVSALLGAFWAQKSWGLPAIGGKDSMSGSFTDLHVPPTLISFAVTTGDSGHVISSDVGESGLGLYLLKTELDPLGLPDIGKLKSDYNRFHSLVVQGAIHAAVAVRSGGLLAAATRMSLGNKVGLRLENVPACGYGSILFASGKALDNTFTRIGETENSGEIRFNGRSVSLVEAERIYTEPLSTVFSDQTSVDVTPLPVRSPANVEVISPKPRTKSVRPRVLIPLFYGQNCENDTADRFSDAGADPRIMVFRNRSGDDIRDSLSDLRREISNAQILMIVGGFSAGDEPDGSGKYIANVLRNSHIADEIHKLLDRDGLVCGICNGFQALVKSGLLPDGRISIQKEDSPTLFRNSINRHVSRLVKTRVITNRSPWLSLMEPGEIHTVAVSHGEGRFVADTNHLKKILDNDQLAFQYVDEQGNPTMNPAFNPNESLEAIEGLISPDGKVLGKMAHSERFTDGCFKNIPGNKTQSIFMAGVRYFS
jgi:phosphoribosylformylglycinamidine synthase